MLHVICLGANKSLEFTSVLMVFLSLVGLEIQLGRSQKE
jgi:hypothetical protein